MTFAPQMHFIAIATDIQNPYFAMDDGTTSTAINTYHNNSQNISRMDIHRNVMNAFANIIAI